MRDPKAAAEHNGRKLTKHGQLQRAFICTLPLLAAIIRADSPCRSEFPKRGELLLILLWSYYMAWTDLLAYLEGRLDFMGLTEDEKERIMEIEPEASPVFTWNASKLGLSYGF
jgi:hypothetical protein